MQVEAKPVRRIRGLAMAIVSPVARWPGLAHALALLAVTAGSAAYLLDYLDRGWIPHDEGLLAHSAERFLGGELPHRDFDEIYTGGLTFLHALAFQALGTRFTSLRMVLFLITVAGFVPSLYSILARRSPWWLAAISTFTCVVWSVPNYFAALPSWYILFFTVFATLALLRYVDTGSRRWLVMAGFWGGLSLLCKVSGLFFLAAALIFLAYHEQVEAVSLNRTSGRASAAARAAFTALIGTVLVFLLLLLLRRNLGVMEVVHFVFPCAALCTLLAWNEWRDGNGTFFERLTRLSRTVLYFLAGVTIPVACFLAPYLLGNGLADLFYGVFILPQLRLSVANERLPPPVAMLPVVLPAVVLVAGIVWPKDWTGFRKALAYGIPAAAAIGFLVFGKSMHYWNFLSLRGVLPVVVCAAVVLLLRSGRQTLSGRHRQEIFLLVIVASLGSLIQYPQAFPIYFCYCAPLVLMAVHFVTAVPWCRLGLVRVGLMGFYLLFGLLVLNRGYCLESLSLLEFRYPLNVARGGLEVLHPQQVAYETVVRLVQAETPPGSFIYAAPDCPEIYFLANRNNPTRTMLDFFDAPEGRTERILAALDEHRVEMIVINLAPAFSSGIDGELAAALATRFPRQRRVGSLVIAQPAIAGDRVGNSTSSMVTQPTALAEGRNNPDPGPHKGFPDQSLPGTIAR